MYNVEENKHIESLLVSLSTRLIEDKAETEQGERALP
jgi:hypothetical protein